MVFRAVDFPMAAGLFGIGGLFPDAIRHVRTHAMSSSTEGRGRARSFRGAVPRAVPDTIQTRCRRSVSARLDAFADAVLGAQPHVLAIPRGTSSFGNLHTFIGSLTADRGRFAVEDGETPLACFSQRSSSHTLATHPQ